MTRTTFEDAADALYVAAADARTDARQQHLLARDAYAADDAQLAAEHAARAAELDAIADRLYAAAVAADIAEPQLPAGEVGELVAWLGVISEQSEAAVKGTGYALA